MLKIPLSSRDRYDSSALVHETARPRLGVFHLLRATDGLHRAAACGALIYPKLSTGRVHGKTFKQVGTKKRRKQTDVQKAIQKQPDLNITESRGTGGERSNCEICSNQNKCLEFST
ncbi:uncharacterized protein YALI1_D31490g [Yarrowia lipolytica]|uniref:Uncharacterized protein n=1 Tax=Yarrowia lipolytica TaxID=4952 RepID=A0A1D8NFY1_YARLL|nr:hypothetical protein YALI1_D31490g [Yarrowia lipolytica]